MAIHVSAIYGSPRRRAARDDGCLMIPYGRQDISQADIDAVVDVLKSDFLTQGPAVPQFEATVASYVGAQHAVAVNSATSALHIACLALELRPGDWLWTSPITFVASSNCALYCGAKVDFVDIDPHTYNLSPVALEQKLIQAEREGRLPKIVVPVHLCGQPCDMKAINALSQKYGFKIIEDASHAIGASYASTPSLRGGAADVAIQNSKPYGSPCFAPRNDNKDVVIARSEAKQSSRSVKVGACAHSDITIFSFHPVKIITTAEGGMALTNNAELARRMQRYRSHGITSDAGEMKARPADEIWNYQQIRLGFNYRMTDIQAALGVSQMTRLDEFVAKRHAIARHYDEALAELPLITPWQHSDSYSAYHLYPIRVDANKTKVTQRQLYDALLAKGINVNLHYIPVYRQPYYAAMGFKQGYCPNAEAYFKSAISIPMFPTLTADQQDIVIKLIRQVMCPK